MSDTTGGSAQGLGEGPVLGRLADFPDRAAAPVACHAGGREPALLVMRRGDDLRAWRDLLCPRRRLPLTWHGRRVLGVDRERLRCSNHRAEFAAADGRAPPDPARPLSREADPP